MVGYLGIGGEEQTLVKPSAGRYRCAVRFLLGDWPHSAEGLAVRGFDDLL